MILLLKYLISIEIFIFISKQHSVENNTTKIVQNLYSSSIRFLNIFSMLHSTDINPILYMVDTYVYHLERCRRAREFIEDCSNYFIINTNSIVSDNFWCFKYEICLYEWLEVPSKKIKCIWIIIIYYNLTEEQTTQLSHIIKVSWKYRSLSA